MNETILLNDEQVKEALSYPTLIALMESLFIGLAKKEVQMLPRSMMRHENGNMLAIMTASLPKQGVWGCKTAIFPGSAAVKEAQSTVQVFDTQTGLLKAVVSAEYITQARTAASSAVATARLAKPDASVLSLLGGGKQALSHAKAICCIRPISEIRVWCRDAARCKAACAVMEKEIGVHTVPAQSAKEGVQGADIVCTVTSSPQPILNGEWLAPGAHVNAVGACGPFSRELETSVLKRSRVFVDSLDSMPMATGDLMIPIRDGEYRLEDLAGELGDVLIGTKAGRKAGDTETITVFESCGLAMQDVGAAFEALKNAKGQTFSF